MTNDEIKDAYTREGGPTRKQGDSDDSGTGTFEAVAIITATLLVTSGLVYIALKVFEVLK